MNSEINSPGDSVPGLLAITTLVFWVVCTCVGLAGLWIHYPRPILPAAPNVQTQLVNVELPKETATPPPDTPPPEPAPPSPVLATLLPQVPPSIAVPDAPTVTPVAAPSAAVAFAVPVEGLTRIVDASQAAHAGARGGAATTGTGQGRGPAVPAAPAITPLPQVQGPPVVTRLTYGQGEGRQPLPEYPREAAEARQQGTVTVRFSVDETGTVTSAQIPPGGGTRFPLLNQSALRTVREAYRFPPGPPRLYEIPIQFEIPK